MPSLVDESIPIPKYYQVYQMLRDNIESGEYPTGSRIPSERALVELFGVSRITVIKAIDMLEQEHLIERRQGLGNYVIDPVEKSVEKRPNVITFVVPYGMDQFPTKIIVGAAQAATDNEMFLQILPIPQNQSLSIFFHSLSLTPTDGTIMFGRRNELAHFVEEFNQYSQGPVILIDRYIDHYEGDYVIFDDEKAGYQLTQHLLSLGYERIGFVPGIEVTTTSVIGRLRGYKKALEDAGKAFDENLICVGYESVQASASTQENIPVQSTHALVAYMQQYQPDALIAVNSLMLDTLTHDLMGLRNQHLRSRIASIVRAMPDGHPEDLYDIGLAAICDHWQNIKYDRLHVIAYQDGYDLGVVAMRLMVDRIKNPLRSFQHVILPMQLQYFPPPNKGQAAKFTSVEILKKTS